MAPKADNDKGYDDSVANADLLEDAGAVHLDEAQPWGRGMIKDFKTTVGTHWVSEMTNFNQKTVAVSLLMFITVVAPTLTFGAVYSTNLENHIGAVETILATAWVGVFFSLFSGMPTVIVGSTGPILIISTVIYDMTKSMGVPFMTFYAWVSIWACAYTTFVAFFDLTRYVKLATKFTDDIFALLIVSIFILNAIGSPFGDGGLLRLLDPNNKGHDKFKDEYGDDYNFLLTALLSIVLGVGTCAMIFYLRSYKTSSYFCNQTSRDLVSDFAVTTAVVFWTIIQQLGFDSVPITGLAVPESFEPTYACCDSSCTTFWPDECEDQPKAAGTRNWFADLGDLNGVGYAPIAAAGPAVLAFLLFYLDNGITWHLIYNPSNRLEHGDSYNWDLFLNGLANMINGLLGLPWLVATTVPCIVHLNNLAERDRDGNVIKVQETRLTYFFSHLLLGLSLLFLNILKKIPLAVLLGVFLFMGLSSLPGLQMWNRFLLFFQQPSLYPQTPYTKYVELSRVHKYTCFQIAFFLGVFLVQNFKVIAIAFPFMTMLCIPGRLFLLPNFFEGWELLLLDGEQQDIEEWMNRKQASIRNIDVEAGDDEDY